MRPKIKDLQAFTKLHFKRNCPIVKWKKMKDMQGIVDEKKNIIYLNPEIPLKGWGCRVGEIYYKPKRKVRLKDGEQYFFTLIHEIGHFKIKLKSSKEFKLLKKRLQREYPNDLDM